MRGKTPGRYQITEKLGAGGLSMLRTNHLLPRISNAELPVLALLIFLLSTLFTTILPGQDDCKNLTKSDAFASFFLPPSGGTHTLQVDVPAGKNWSVGSPSNTQWLKFNIDPRSAGKATIIVSAEPNMTSSCRLASLSISGVNPWYPLRLDIWQAGVPDSTPSGALNIGPFPKEPDKAKNLPPPTTAQGGAAAVAQPKRPKPTESPSPDSAMAKGASSGAGGTVSNAQQNQRSEEPSGAALTNKQVLELLSIGISPEIVIAKITTSECQFDTSVEALKELKNAKAPQEVILAMLGISKSATAPRDSGSVKAPTVDASATATTIIESSHREAKPADLDVELLSSGEKIRVFVTDSQSWQMNGSAVAVDSTGAGHFSGGARPQNAEIAKTVRQRCPELTVTINRENADFILTLDHEGGKGYARRDNKWAVYSRDGDMISGGSTRSLGNSVKDACAVILNKKNK